MLPFHGEIIIVAVLLYLIVGSILADRYRMQGRWWLAWQVGWAFFWTAYEPSYSAGFRQALVETKKLGRIRAIWLLDHLPPGRYRDGFRNAIVLNLRGKA